MLRSCSAIGVSILLRGTVELGLLMGKFRGRNLLSGPVEAEILISVRHLLTIVALENVSGSSMVGEFEKAITL